MVSIDPMPATITLTKRICAASDGYQFLTSGFPNRSRDKKTFDTVDGLFVRRPLLPDLRPTESDIQGDTRGRQGIQVALTLRRTYRPGHRKMWVFGFRSQSRCLTQYKPRAVTPTDGGCTALVKLGTLYLDEWTTRDYFPDQPAGEIFPVWVKVERISNENEKEKI